MRTGTLKIIDSLSDTEDDRETARQLRAYFPHRRPSNFPDRARARRFVSLAAAKFRTLGFSGDEAEFLGLASLAYKIADRNARNEKGVHIRHWSPDSYCPVQIDPIDALMKSARAAQTF